MPRNKAGPAFLWCKGSGLGLFEELVDLELLDLLNSPDTAKEPYSIVLGLAARLARGRPPFLDLFIIPREREKPSKTVLQKLTSTPSAAAARSLSGRNSLREEPGRRPAPRKSTPAIGVKASAGTRSKGWERRRCHSTRSRTIRTCPNPDSRLQPPCRSSRDLTSGTRAPGARERDPQDNRESRGNAGRGRWKLADDGWFLKNGKTLAYALRARVFEYSALGFEVLAAEERERIARERERCPHPEWIPFERPCQCVELESSRSRPRRDWERRRMHAAPQGSALHRMRRGGTANRVGRSMRTRPIPRGARPRHRGKERARGMGAPGGDRHRRAPRLPSCGFRGEAIQRARRPCSLTGFAVLNLVNAIVSETQEPKAKRAATNPLPQDGNHCLSVVMAVVLVPARHLRVAAPDGLGRHAVTVASGSSGDTNTPPRSTETFLRASSARWNHPGTGTGSGTLFVVLPFMNESRYLGSVTSETQRHSGLSEGICANRSSHEANVREVSHSCNSAFCVIVHRGIGALDAPSGAGSVPTQRDLHAVDVSSKRSHPSPPLGPREIGIAPLEGVHCAIDHLSHVTGIETPRGRGASPQNRRFDAGPNERRFPRPESRFHRRCKSRTGASRYRCAWAAGVVPSPRQSRSIELNVAHPYPLDDAPKGDAAERMAPTGTLEGRVMDIGHGDVVDIGEVARSLLEMRTADLQVEMMRVSGDESVMTASPDVRVAEDEEHLVVRDTDAVRVDFQLGMRLSYLSRADFQSLNENPSFADFPSPRARAVDAAHQRLLTIRTGDTLELQALCAFDIGERIGLRFPVNASEGALSRNQPPKPLHILVRSDVNDVPRGDRAALLLDQAISRRCRVVRREPLGNGRPPHPRFSPLSAGLGVACAHPGAGARLVALARLGASSTGSGCSASSSSARHARSSRLRHRDIGLELAGREKEEFSV